MLHLLSASDALRHGAACLDGSQPGIWYDAPSVPKSFKGTRKLVADAGGNRSWLIMLDGGAWCYSAAECLERASSVMGSSKSFSRHFWPYSGPMSADFAINPAFAGFHRVLFGYCDGSSFLGDSTVDVAGTSKGQQPRRAFLRGRRNVEALLHMLVEMGMGDAEEVLLGGTSAGGVGALHAANFARRLVPKAKKFKVLLLSGFFLLRPQSFGLSDVGTESKSLRGSARMNCHADNCRPWVHKMASMFELHNASAAMSPSCAAAFEPASRWRCLFPNVSAAWTDLPIFVINSAIDSWQIANVWRFHQNCRWDGCGIERTRRDVGITNYMIRSFVQDLNSSGLISRPGNGAFIVTCNEHVAGLGLDAYIKYVVNGVSMRDALAQWWAAPIDSPTQDHVRLPCELRIPNTHPSENDVRAGGRQDLGPKFGPTVGLNLDAHAAANSSQIQEVKMGVGLSAGVGSGALAHHECNPSCLSLRPRKRWLNAECPCEETVHAAWMPEQFRTSRPIVAG